MTCDDWNKFIQVNIYGRTLQELNRKGIVLETVLNDIGCSKVWIVEGSMYNSSVPHSSSEEIDPDEVDPEDISIEPPPALSTTLATVRCPRFSTPVVSQFNLERKFTLNLPENYSRIDSSHEEKFLVNQDYSDLDVEEALDEIIEKVVETFEVRNVILSTTVTKIDVPRRSTPILPQTNRLETVTLNIPEMISDIESNDEEEIISEKEEDTERNVIRDIKSKTQFPLKRRITRRFSALNLKCNMKMEDELMEPKKKRPALSRSTTERDPDHLIKFIKRAHSAHLEDLYDENTPEDVTLANNSPPRVYSFEMDQDFDNNYENVEGEAEVDTSTQETKPFTVMSPEGSSPRNQSDHVSYMNLNPIKGEIPNPPEERKIQLFDHNNQRDYSTDMDYDEDDFDYFSAPEGDETEVMILDDQSQGNYTPPPPGLINTKSILKSMGKGDDGEDKGIKKTVSFGIPKNKMTARQLKLNETHQIKCHFENCDKVLSWKIRYGKQRLLDHAMSHIEDKCLACGTCDAPFSTSRQINYHYKKMHPEKKCNNFNILEVFKLELDDVAVGDIFDKCFGPHSALVGKVSKLGNLRQKREKKATTKRVEEDNEEDDKDVPSTSNGLFYFRRIY